MSTIKRINDINVGGSIANGQWIPKYLELFRQVASTAFNTEKTFSVSSYLPDDNYDYEVLVSGYVYSGQNSGSWAQIYVSSGSSSSRDQVSLGATQSMRDGFHEAGNLAKLPIKATDRNIKVFIQGSSPLTNSTLYNNVELHGYRRIGKATNGINNIAISSLSKNANVLNYGGISITNGVASGFDYFKFLELPLMPQDNTEYTVCFTIGDITVNQGILMCPDYFSIEQKSANVVVWNFTGGTDVTVISNVSVGSKYWIKYDINGSNRVVKYSTDGTNYTQVASFTDASSISNTTYIRIGNHFSNLVDRYFRGTIDLNECSMKVNGNTVWKGMDYLDRERIGGDIFDGTWKRGGTYASPEGVQNLGYIFSGNWTQGNTYTYNLKSMGLLPNDNYAYEVIIGGWSNAGSGEWRQTKVFTNVFTNSMIINACTGKGRGQDYWCTAPVPVPPDGIIKFYINGTSGASRAAAWYLCSYKRLGTNE